jgi:hypothetical protein
VSRSPDTGRFWDICLIRAGVSYRSSQIRAKTSATFRIFPEISPVLKFQPDFFGFLTFKTKIFPNGNFQSKKKNGQSKFQRERAGHDRS